MNKLNEIIGLIRAVDYKEPFAAGDIHIIGEEIANYVDNLYDKELYNECLSRMDLLRKEFDILCQRYKKYWLQVDEKLKNSQEYIEYAEYIENRYKHLSVQTVGLIEYYIIYIKSWFGICPFDEVENKNSFDEKQSNRLQILIHKYESKNKDKEFLNERELAIKKLKHNNTVLKLEASETLQNETEFLNNLKEEVALKEDDALKQSPIKSQIKEPNPDVIRPYLKFIPKKDENKGDYFITKVLPILMEVPIKSKKDFCALAYIVFNERYYISTNKPVFKGFCTSFAEAIGYELKGEPSKPNKAAIHADEMKGLYPFLSSIRDLKITN